MVENAGSDSVGTDFIIRSETEMHLRPMLEITKYFRELRRIHESVSAAIELVEPTNTQFDSIDPCGMIGLLEFVVNVQRSANRNDFKIRLTGPSDPLLALTERVQSEVQAIVDGWGKFKET